MRGLLLIRAERAQLALRLEQFLHRRGPHRTRQLLLQVGVTRVKAELLEIVAREVLTEARASQSKAEVALLRGIVQAGETDIEPRGSVLLEEAAEVPVAAHR